MLYHKESMSIMKQDRLDLRKTSRLYGSPDRAKTVLSEGVISVDTASEEKQFAAGLVKHSGAGILRKSSRKKAAKLLGNQEGMASILITMITMIVVTLIVLGFATISRREQGNTLNQQLSTQAFYAAESAVNDARQVINSAISNGLAVPGKTSCNTNTDGAGYTPNYPVPTGTQNGVPLDTAHSVSYTCLLVDPSPSSLVKDGVGDDSWVVPVNSTSSFDTIQIQWKPDPAVGSGKPSADCPASSGKFYPSSGGGDWACGYGLLRVDTVPTSGALSEGGLSGSQLTGFFEPERASGSGNLSYGGGHVGKANIVVAKCDVGFYGTCTANITGLSGKSYTLRLVSLYKTSDITITPMSGGSPVSTDSQVLVDATGNANGVLRRIQVHIPVTDYSGTIPGFAIQSNSAVCKRFFATPSYYANAGDVPNPESNKASPNYNPMCDNSYPTSGSP
jgi:Tfp pilus assembly protein PilX